MATQLGLISPLPFPKSSIFSFHNSQIFHDIPGRSVVAPKVETFHQEENERKRDEIARPVSSMKEVKDDVINTGDCVQKEADIPIEKATGYDSEECSFDAPDTLNDSREENDSNGEFSGDTSVSTKQCSLIQNYNADKYIEVTENVITDEEDRKVLQYECKVCNKSYRSRDSARKHMHGHYGFKPFKCQICDKAFVEKKVLQIHMRTHTGEKPYSCQLCNKSFSQSIQLLRHKRMHTGNTPYKCDICNKVFSQRFCVERHRKVHFHPKIKRYQNTSLDVMELKSVKSTENNLLNDEISQIKTEGCLSDGIVSECEKKSVDFEQQTVSDSPEKIVGLLDLDTPKRKHAEVDGSTVTSPKGIILKRYKEENKFLLNVKSEDNKVADSLEKSEVKSADINDVGKLKRRKQNNPQKKFKSTSEVIDEWQTISKSKVNIRDSEELYQFKSTNVGLHLSDESKEHSSNIEKSVFKYISGSPRNERIDGSGGSQSPDIKCLSKNSSSETKDDSPHEIELLNGLVHPISHVDGTNSKEVEFFKNSLSTCKNLSENGTKNCSLNKHSLPRILSEPCLSHKNQPLHSLFRMNPLNCNKDKIDRSSLNSSINLPFPVSNNSLPFVSNYAYSQSLLFNSYPFLGISAQNVSFMNQSVHNTDYLSNINKENSNCQSQALDLSKKSFDSKVNPVENKLVLNKMNSSLFESDVKINNDDPKIAQPMTGEISSDAITCTVCSKHYRSKENLRKHMKKHEGSKPHKCDQCGKAFLDKKVLEIHYRRHTGEKPYRCDDCNVGYAQSVQLLRHMRRVHTKDFPFRCEYCHKGFSCNFTLKRHVRIHTGEKPFICDLCGEAFAYDTSYKIHVMRHSGEQPHECFCGKKFLQKSRLVLHQESHSPSELTGKRFGLGDLTQKGEEVLRNAVENFNQSITNFSRQFCAGAKVTSNKFFELKDDTHVNIQDCDNQSQNSKECGLRSTSSPPDPVCKTKHQTTELSNNTIHEVLA